jgi:hypothetical protein
MTSEAGRVAIDRRTLTLIAVLPILIACSLLLSQTSAYGLLGHDTYPIIASSRVQSWGDFTGNFTERLMDGRYPGAFYRPLLNLTFAADHALWGLNATGYQLTNVLIFGCCALALFGLAGRLAENKSLVVPFVTLLAFLVHPTHFEVLPVPARRPELLCCAFMALSLWLQLSPKALRSQRAPIWPAVAALAAIASKETGFALPLISFVVVLLYAREMTPVGRLRRAWKALMPHAVVVAVMLAARMLVLGGIGGHRSVSFSEVLSSAPSYLATVARELILPQPVMRATILAPLLMLGLTLGLVITGVMLSLNRAAGGSGRASQILSAKILITALTWIVVVCVTYAAAGWLGPWYYLLPVAGASILFGGIFERFVGLARQSGTRVRWPAGATLLCLSLLLVWHAWYSPLIHRYDEWSRATTVSAEFLDEAAHRIALSSSESVILAPPLPIWVRPAEGQATIFGAAVLNVYSVQAWADLTLPDRRVVVKRAPAQVPDTGEALLLITGRLSGY